MTKSLDEIIASRQSCRSFTDRPVEKEKLESLVGAVRLAPSACNSQPWKLIIVTGEKLRALKDAVQLEGRNKFTEECTVLTIFVEKKATLARGVTGRIHSQAFAQMDIGAAVSYYTLKATDLGLSTCILGWFDEEKIIADFGFSEEEKVRLVVATGYSTDGYELRNKVRKDSSEIADFIG